MVTLSMADMLVFFGLLGSLGVVVFASGRLTARVESLESWRAQMSHELDAIHAGQRRIEARLEHLAQP